MDVVISVMVAGEIYVVSLGHKARVATVCACLLYFQWLPSAAFECPTSTVFKTIYMYVSIVTDKIKTGFKTICLFFSTGKSCPGYFGNQLITTKLGRLNYIATP